MLLAIDTSVGTSVAVVDRDGGVLAEMSDADRLGHAAVVGALIERALETSGTEPSALSGVAVGMGPGPFGGLGVGIAAARGFAIALRRPVVPILSHDAVALDRLGPTLVVSDAGESELAWTAFGAPDAELRLPTRRGDPAVVAASAIVEVDGYPQYERVDVHEVSAGALGMLAERLFAGKRAFARSEPYYFRAPRAAKDMALKLKSRHGE